MKFLTALQAQGELTGLYEAPKLAQIKAIANHAGAEQSRLDEIFTVAYSLRNRPLAWDEALIRQMVECVRVVSKEKLRMTFL